MENRFNMDSDSDENGNNSNAVVFEERSTDAYFAERYINMV